MNSTALVVDMRSDSYTRPRSDTLQEGMIASRLSGVGLEDPKSIDDPSTLVLERHMAEFAGFENALFMPTATMANLIAEITHLNGSTGGCVVLGDLNHSYLFSDDAISCVHMVPIHTNPDGTLSLEELSDVLQQNKHNKVVVSLENTHSRCAGAPLSFDFQAQCKTIVDEHRPNAWLHCDGSRLWHAGVSSSTSEGPFFNVKVFQQHCQYYDSVTLCFCKALGAPMGACLLGSNEFITRARNVRRVMGGALWQSGYFAVMCQKALQTQLQLLYEDHKKALYIARQLEAVPHIRVLPAETNVVIFEVNSLHQRDMIIQNCAERGVYVGYLCALGGECAAPPCVRLIPNFNHSWNDVEHAVSVVICEIEKSILE